MINNTLKNIYIYNCNIKFYEQNFFIYNEEKIIYPICKIIVIIYIYKYNSTSSMGV